MNSNGRRGDTDEEQLGETEGEFEPVGVLLRLSISYSLLQLISLTLSFIINGISSAVSLKALRSVRVSLLALCIKRIYFFACFLSFVGIVLFYCAF